MYDRARKVFLSRECLTQRLELAAAACGCSKESAIQQVPALHMSFDALSARSLKQVLLQRVWGSGRYLSFLFHSQLQLVASNQSQVGSGLAEGIYVKVCKADVVVDRFKIVRQGFIAGDGGRHWMHHHVGGERPRNSVVHTFASSTKEEQEDHHEGD
jgi:hypothetical protein